MNRRFIALLLGCIAATSSCGKTTPVGEMREPEFRTWTDATGNLKIEAALLDLKDGKVQLKKKNGGLLTIPLEKLSREDQECVESELRRRRLRLLGTSLLCRLRRRKRTWILVLTRN